jgi:hypothetical protein
VIPPVDHLARKKYCKWHDSLSHTTNECIYFCRQIQSTMDDEYLTLGEAHQLKLDTYPFPVDLLNLRRKEYWCSRIKLSLPGARM